MSAIDALIEQLQPEDCDLEAEVDFPVLGNTILTIGLAESGNIEETQKHSLNWFYQAIPELHAEIQTAVFEYYQSSMARYRKKLSGKADKLMPALQNQDNVWLYVTEPGIFIFPQDEGGELHLEFECSFDKDNGLRVVFENEQLVRVAID